jgi:hypothetical protein
VLLPLLERVGAVGVICAPLTHMLRAGDEIVGSGFSRSTGSDAGLTCMQVFHHEESTIIIRNCDASEKHNTERADEQQRGPAYDHLGAFLRGCNCMGSEKVKDAPFYYSGTCSPPP